MGCLITDDIEFPDEVACPPSIETGPAAPQPLNRVIKVDTQADAPDAGVGQVDFEVTIRDCNESQRLQYQALLDYDPDFGGTPAPFSVGTIQPGTRDPFAFSLPFSALSGGEGGCHKVELFVTTRFVFGDIEPTIPGDIGTATWWLAVTNEANPTVDMVQCR